MIFCSPWTVSLELWEGPVSFDYSHTEKTMYLVTLFVLVWGTLTATDRLHSLFTDKGVPNKYFPDKTRPRYLGEILIIFLKLSMVTMKVEPEIHENNPKIFTSHGAQCNIKIIL